MIDSYLHRGLRQKLIKTLKRKGIKDQRILDAFQDIPRHYFLDPGFAEWAYKDIAFPIGNKQTISQPYTVAIQTILLDVKPKQKILEIGTGSGFQACVLAYLGAKVYTIERQRQLYIKTNTLLEKIGFGHIRTLYGDGYLGAPKFAPFDRILLTAGATDIPQTLLDQLKIGGIMVIPLGEGNTQEMVKITKISETEIKKEKHGLFAFVPFLSGTNK